MWSSHLFNPLSFIFINLLTALKLTVLNFLILKLTLILKVFANYKMLLLTAFLTCFLQGLLLLILPIHDSIQMKIKQLLISR